jgi:hypothetical protein
MNFMRFFCLITNKIIKIIDYSGKEIVDESKIPFIKIFDDGSVERKIIIE